MGQLIRNALTDIQMSLDFVSYEMEVDFAQKIEAEFNKMIERITHEN